MGASYILGGVALFWIVGTLYLELSAEGHEVVGNWRLCTALALALVFGFLWNWVLGAEWCCGKDHGNVPERRRRDQPRLKCSCWRLARALGAGIKGTLAPVCDGRERGCDSVSELSRGEGKDVYPSLLWPSRQFGSESWDGAQSMLWPTRQCQKRRAGGLAKSATMVNWVWWLIVVQAIRCAEGGRDEALAAGAAWATGSAVAAAGAAWACGSAMINARGNNQATRETEVNSEPHEASWRTGEKTMRRPGRRVQRAKKKWIKGLECEDPRRTEAEKPDSVFFGNITEWGQQAKSYILSEHGLEAEGRWSMVGLAEHHLDRKNIHKLRSTMGLLGFRTCAVPAEKTGRSEDGTHGGVSVSVKRGLAATLVGPEAEHQGEHTLWGEGWATVVQHRKGLDVAVTCAYFDCGGGKLKATNAKRAREIRACHAALGIPWVLAADFNATPSEIAASGLHALLGGQVVTPVGVSYTCSAGQKRMLDYWLCSDTARPFFTNERAVVVPWKPHCGIAFDWVTNANDVMGMAHETAKAVLSPANATCTMDKVQRSSDGQWEEAAWLAGKGEAAYRTATRKQDGAAAKPDGNQGEEWQVGKVYARWGAQMAGCLALGNDIAPALGVRCAVRTTRLQPLYRARKAKERPGLTLPASAVGFAWAGAESCLRTVVHFHGTGRGKQQLDDAVQWLLARVAGKLRTLWIPKRVKEWVPGMRPKHSRLKPPPPTESQAAPLRKGYQPYVTTSADDGAPTTQRGRRAEESSCDDEAEDGHKGHTIWREVEASTAELARWRFFIGHPAAAGKMDWVSMMIEAARMSAVAKKKARAQARREAVQRAKECLDGSASKAHGYVKPKSTVLDLMDLAQETDEDGKLTRVASPDVAVQRKGQSWHDLWDRDRAQRESLTKKVQDLRRSCREEDDDEELVSTAAVKVGIKKLNASAVAGLDATTARELAALPDAAIEQLAGILNQINRRVAWPRQALHHQIVLLAKPRGGQRPICLVAMIIKL